MRVCVVHWRPVYEVLTSKRTGTEYDLCTECMDMIQNILVETPRPTKEQIDARDAPPETITGLQDMTNRNIITTSKPKKTWSRRPKPKE